MARQIARLLVGAVALATVSACTPAPRPTTTLPGAPASSTSARQPTATPSGKAPLSSPDRQRLPLPRRVVPGMVDAPAGTGMERYTRQTLTWQPCGKLECADVAAPMDYANPDGQAITLHLSRRPAKEARQGAILVNPGGPGEPAEDLVGAKRWNQLVGFDIVGWDPRGTGKSTPVVCYDGQDQPLKVVDDALALDQSPDDEAEYQAYASAGAAFARSCAEHSGDYLKFISTAQTVQDMDLVRELLKEPKLNFVGYSYGTWLGSVYATYYPDKVGRMLLDSAVNVTDDESIIQAQGFDRALGLFAQWSAKRGTFGRSPEEVVAKLGEFLDGLDADPIKVGDRTLTQSLAVTGIVTMLYGGEEDWAYLEQVLRPAMSNRDGTKLLYVADFMNDRDQKGVYGGRYFAFPAILCADAPDRGLSAAREQWAEDMRKAPFFGKYFGPGTTCEQWAVPPIPQITVAAPTSAPIVVIGSTGDAATPYEYAGWMADQLGSGVLLTWDGPGHGSYGNGNACLDGAVDAYFKEGTVPAKGTVCKP